jgi:FtsH-binding integral membrane protein
MSYPVPPPSYSSAKPHPDGSSEPLLGGPRATGSGAGGIYDQPAPGDLPDDFKYGTTVSECSSEIRNAYVRKVYTILFCQILATSIVSGALSQSSSAIIWVQTHPWSFYVPLFGTLINLGFLYWKRHSHPTNLILLSTFTLLEAFTIGVVVAFYDTMIVLEALLITLGVFLGLTLFTFQSKWDFSGMGPFLFAGLLALVMTSFVTMFFTASRTTDIIISLGATLLFSGYIVYDTYMINSRLSPDEYILGAISLYLDFINLFLNMLRLLNDLQE